MKLLKEEYRKFENHTNYKTPTGLTMSINDVYISYDTSQPESGKVIVRICISYPGILHGDYRHNSDVYFELESPRSLDKIYNITREEYIEEWIKQHSENVDPEDWRSRDDWERAIDLADALGFVLETSKDTFPKYRLSRKDRYEDKLKILNSSKTFTSDMHVRDAYELYNPFETELDNIRNDITLGELWEKISTKGGETIRAAMVNKDYPTERILKGLKKIIAEAIGMNVDDYKYLISFGINEA